MIIRPRWRQRPPQPSIRPGQRPRFPFWERTTTARAICLTPGPPPRRRSGVPSPTFSVNGTNAAKNTTVTFGAAGTYHLTATIADAGGLSVTSNATVVVRADSHHNHCRQPADGYRGKHGNAAVRRHLHRPIWQAVYASSECRMEATGGGITSAGLFTAGPGRAGSVTVTATSGSIQGTANVTDANAPPLPRRWRRWPALPPT